MMQTIFKWEIVANSLIFVLNGAISQKSMIHLHPLHPPYTTYLCLLTSMSSNFQKIHEIPLTSRYKHIVYCKLQIVSHLTIYLYVEFANNSCKFHIKRQLQLSTLKGHLECSRKSTTWFNLQLHILRSRYLPSVLPNSVFRF